MLPNAGFAWGDRYEFGYRDRGNGWMIGILDGPTQQQGKLYGMTTGITDLDYRGEPLFPPGSVGGGNTNPNAQTPGPQSDEFFALGFGNVHVNFATPAGYLQGFRDYLNYLAGAAIGTQVGPVAYVGNYGGTQEAARIQTTLRLLSYVSLTTSTKTAFLVRSSFWSRIPHPGAFL